MNYRSRDISDNSHRDFNTATQDEVVISDQVDGVAHRTSDSRIPSGYINELVDNDADFSENINNPL